MPGVTFNFPLIAYAALTILAIRAIVRDAPLAPPADAVPAARRAAAAARALVVPCALYALVWPILGLTDLGLAGPFSSLRVHGGSNHLVVPTGLLQAAFADSAGGAFGGGVVRVSACTSEYILSVTLPDCSALLPPRAREPSAPPATRRCSTTRRSRGTSTWRGCSPSGLRRSPSPRSSCAACCTRRARAARSFR